MLAQLHEEEGIPWDGLIYLPSNPDILEGEGWDIYHATANYIMDQLVQQPVISNHHIDKAPRGWGIDFRTPIRPVDEPTILGGRSQVVIFYDQTILKPFSHQRCRYERWLVVGASFHLLWTKYCRREVSRAALPVNLRKTCHHQKGRS